MGGQPQVSVYISHIVDYAGREPLGGQGVERRKRGACLMAGMEYGGFRTVLRTSYLRIRVGGILAGSGYLAADHSGWRAFDAVIWKKNTNPEPGVVCSRTGRRIYDAGASSETDGGEDCVLYAGTHTGGGIFLSPGKPQNDGALSGRHDHPGTGLRHDTVQHALLDFHVWLGLGKRWAGWPRTGIPVPVRGSVFRCYCHDPVL